MTKYINIIIVAYIITLILSTIANADDMWETKSQIAGGSIYPQEEYPDITLEKMLIIYQEEGNCKVHFLFKNSGNKLVSAEVGFPVEFIVPFEMGFSDPAIEILGKVFGEENFESLDYLDPWERPKAKTSIINTYKKLMLERNKFDDINTYWTECKWVDHITIFQDDKSINIDSVLVVGKITTGDTAYIQFHFLHKLLFKPSSFTHVTVEYSINSVVCAYGDPPSDGIFHEWHYVLGTGRIWNGPIDAVYLAIPEHLTPNLPKTFTRIGNLKKNTYYLAKNYEPLVNDKTNCSYLARSFPPSSVSFTLEGEYVLEALDGYELKPDTLEIIKLEEPKKPVQNFVVVKKASSYLPQRTWVNSNTIMNIPFNHPYWSLFSHFQPSSNTVKWVAITCKNIGFGPLSLFDGIPESAWCEGVPGDGIDEWVEFELKEDVLGLCIHNGFRKVNWYWQATHGNRAEQLKAVYNNNNRVKVLEIISNDGKVKQEIKIQHIPYAFPIQVKHEFENIYLPKGLYKVYIRDIYKGNKYEDTCLGEIEFYSASAKGIIEQDEFLKNVK